MTDYAIDVALPKEFKTKRYQNFGYDRCLYITLYGDPIADSRPRVTGFGAVAVINLQKLKQQFKPLYQSSELLQNLMIHSHFHIGAKIYMKTTQKDLKFIKKNKTIHKKYIKDELIDMNIKDVDNMLKVHNDLIFSNEYRITVDDAYNVGFIEPEKYTSKTPRIELTILYSTKPDAWSRYKIKDSSKYFEHMTCYKYMCMNKRTPKEQVDYLKKYMDNKLSNEPKPQDQIKWVKKLAEVLEEYPADTLKEMGQLEISRKYNKYDASLKVIMLVLSKHKTIVNALTGLERGK